MTSMTDGACRPATALPPPFQALRASLRLVQWFYPAAASRAALMLCVVPITKTATLLQKDVLKQASHFSFSSGGYKVRGYRWGAGPCVVLAHGWGDSAASMTCFVNRLVKAGFAVVALDAPAHGQSTGWTSDMLVYGDALAHIIEEEKPHAIIAHSFGATASLLALENKEMLQPRLVLLSASNDAARSVSDMGLALGLHEDAQNGLLDGLSQRVKRPLCDFVASKTGRSRRAPSLVIHDSGDRLVPVAEGRALSESLVDSVFFETQGLGHTKVLRDAAVIEKIIGFVAGADK